MLIGARIRGVRFCYTHYSLYGAVTSWLVFGCTGGVAYYWNCGMPWLYRRSWLRERVFRLALRRTVLVTGTVGLAREYRRRYRLAYEPRVVPNWIDTARFREFDRMQARGLFAPPIPDAAEIVLFVHRLSRRKGTDVLPDIASMVLRERPDVRFLIVGDGPERQEIASRVRELGIADRVDFFGAIENRLLPRWYRAADVLLVPSEEEGFPHVMLEAMAAEIPFVASYVGGIPDIVPPAMQQWLVHERTPVAFADKLLQLLVLSPSQRSEFGKTAGRHVARYELPAVLKDFSALFS